MSSHHIVKDQQEPALYIEKAISSTDYELISNLLEWSPIVIVNENSLNFALTWNIKIDVVLCSLENLEKIKEQVIFQFPIELIVCKKPSKQDAFEYLKKKEHYALNIFQTDFSTNDLEFVSNEELKIVFFNNEKQAFYCENKWEKWLPKNRKIEFITATTSTFLTTEKDGFYQQEDEKGFWVMEYLTD